MAHPHYSPRYYTRGSIEVWDFIRDQGLNYHLGCAIKYITRAGYKDSKADDLQKAIHYLENELHATLSEPVTFGSGGGVSPGLRNPLEFSFESDPEAFDR